MNEVPAGRRWSLAHPWLRHLRLPFNLLLSPIYLWGVLLAGGSLGMPGFWYGYLSLHLFLYSGATAFNSYYDRDTGPVGGMLRPPPVDEGLLRFSLIVQALGLPLALLVGWGFTLAWLLLFLVFTAYSHPAVRLKADPWRALAAIGLGQGALGFVLGYLAGGSGTMSSGSSVALMGALATTLIVMGLYIVTQSYQTVEDRMRGDRTLPVMLGPRRALSTALALLGSGGLVLVLEVATRFGAGWTLTLALFFMLIGAALFRWAASFDEDAVTRNFRTAMRLTAGSSSFLSLFLLYHLW